MSDNETPLCPQCGGAMRLRRGAKGEFYGCAQYPACKGTRNINGNGSARPAAATPTTQYAPITKMPGSPEQEAIWAALANTDTHLVIEAYAGAGKTHTAVQAVLRLPNLKIASVAYNKHIATEGDGKLRASGCRNATCCTAHSLGLKIIRAAYPRTEINQYKVDGILEQIPIPANMYPETWSSILRLTTKLTELCKHYLLNPKDPSFESALETIADRHGVDLNGSGRAALDLVPGVLAECQRSAPDMIDFDDMVWIPVACNLPIPFHFDILMVDEAQDLNRCQQELMMRACPTGRIVVIGDRHQCQPKGTLVYKTGVGYVPIETIKVGDQLLTHFSGSFKGIGKPGVHVRPQGRAVLEVARRHYNGELVRITAGSHTHDVTPEHRCVVRMVHKRGWAVYVLKRGSRARVGMTRSQDSPAHGVSLRAKQEKAEAAWILAIFDNQADAKLLESLVAYQYNLPQMCFQRHWEVTENTIHTQTWIHNFWRRFPSNIAQLEKCLSDFGRRMDLPFWILSKNGGEAGLKKGSLYTFHTAAANLIEDWMRVCTFEGEQHTVQGDWKPVKLKRVPYCGTVHSLRLDSRWRGGPTYIAQGIVTHNSIYGFRGADVKSIPNMAARLSATERGVETLALTITRRCPKSHAALANTVLEQIAQLEKWPHKPLSAVEDAPEGEIQSLTYTEAVKLARPGDMMLCRVNAKLIPAAYALIARGVKPIIKGRELGMGLVALIEKLEKKATNIPALLEALNTYRANEYARLSAMGRKGAGRLAAMQEKCDCLEEMTHGMNSITELKARITTLFSDEDSTSAVTLGTIHRTKGLEATRVFVLAPELIPHPMAKQDWEYVQELNLAYVACTRAKHGGGQPGTLIFCGAVPPVYHYTPPAPEPDEGGEEVQQPAYGSTPECKP